MDKALIGSSLYMQWPFVDRTDGITPIEVTDPTLKVYGSDGKQIGTTVVLTVANKISTGLYFYNLIVPNSLPYIDVEMSVNNGGYVDMTRDRVYTTWAQDDISEIPSVTLTLNSNTYVTLEEAEAIMPTLFGSSIWNESSENDKARALIQATMNIDTLPMKGVKQVVGQPLQFPRYFYSYESPLYVYDTIIPADVKKATCLEAISVLKNEADPDDRLELQAKGVTQIKNGDASESYSTGRVTSDSMLSIKAKNIMKAYIISIVPIIRGR